MNLRVLILFLFIALPAHAQQIRQGGNLPISVTLIQCGTQAQAKEKCVSDEPRCCSVLDSDPFSEASLEDDLAENIEFYFRNDKDKKPAKQ